MGRRPLRLHGKFDGPRSICSWAGSLRLLGQPWLVRSRDIRKGGWFLSIFAVDSRAPARGFFPMLANYRLKVESTATTPYKVCGNDAEHTFQCI